MQLGELLCTALNKAGFFTLTYPEYPSRIRGGDNNIQIVISSQEDIAPREKVDAVFSFDKSLEIAHKSDLRTGGISFNAVSAGINMIPAVVENSIVGNSALAGFIWKYLSQDLNVLEDIIKAIFETRYTKANLEAARAGYSLFQGRVGLMPKPSQDNILAATGNEVFASSAVKAECEYVSIYPMTPITSLLAHLSKTDLKIVVPEDEIFAALSTLGASYAGKRALTATSGGGFCLMTEAVGFAGMAEIPFVVILGQRPGPSSGMPTYSAQSDLNFAIFSGHDDFPKIVLAPGDLGEIIRLTQEAFNLADRFQVPVIILTDKYLSESRFSSPAKLLAKIKVKIDRGKRYNGKEKGYARYKLTTDGISPRAYPGETTFLTNSYEHDQYGYSTDEAGDKRRMSAKRAKKLCSLKGGFEIYGDPQSKTVVLEWGSGKAQTSEVRRELPGVKFIHIWRVWPFPKELSDVLAKAKKTLVVENNFSGQMAKIIRRETGLQADSILKSDGRPFFKEELLRLIKEKI